MTARIHVAVAVASLALAGSTSNGEVRYTMIDLGPCYQVGFYGIAINNAGQVVGTTDDANGHHRATLFDTSGAGNHIDLGTLGGDVSLAYDINNAGQIVGDAATETGDMRATLFDPTGGGNNLDLGEGSVSAINDLGQIVGASRGDWGAARATLFDPSGGGDNTNLGILDGCTSSVAYAINNLGQVVGFADTDWDCVAPLGSCTGEYMMRAVLFDSTGGGNNVDLGVLSGGSTMSWAWDINDAGQIVGTSWGASATRGTLFAPTGAGNNIDLGTVAGGSVLAVVGINENGQVVGTVDRFSDDPGVLSATSLPMLLDATGANDPVCLSDCSDVEIGYAVDINDNGWIVGAHVTVEKFRSHFEQILDGGTSVSPLVMNYYLLIPVDDKTQAGDPPPNGRGLPCAPVGVLLMGAMIVGLMRVSVGRKQE